MDEGFVSLFLLADLVTRCDISRERLCEVVAANGVTDPSTLLAIANDESRAMGERCIACAIHLVLHRPDLSVEDLRRGAMDLLALEGVSDLAEFSAAQTRLANAGDWVTQ